MVEIKGDFTKTMSKDFSDLIAKAKSGEKKILSVANAQDHAVLEAVDEFWSEMKLRSKKLQVKLE